MTSALECPHCRAAAVPQIQVRWSSRESPVTCAACGELSHVIGSTASGIGSVGCLAVVFAAVAALAMQSWPLALSGLALAVAHNLWAWRRAELFPISPESSRKANQANWWLIGIVVFLKIFSS